MFSIIYIYIYIYIYGGLVNEKCSLSRSSTSSLNQNGLPWHFRWQFRDGCNHGQKPRKRQASKRRQFYFRKTAHVKARTHTFISMFICIALILLAGSTSDMLLCGCFTWVCGTTDLHRKVQTTSILQRKVRFLPHPPPLPPRRCFLHSGLGWNS